MQTTIAVMVSFIVCLLYISDHDAMWQTPVFVNSED